MNRVWPRQQGKGQRQFAFGQARRRQGGGGVALHQIANLHLDMGAIRAGYPSGFGGIIAVEGRAEQALGLEPPALAGGKDQRIKWGEVVIICRAFQQLCAVEMMDRHHTGDRGDRQGEIGQIVIAQIGEGQTPGAFGRRGSGPGVFKKKRHGGSGQ